MKPSEYPPLITLHAGEDTMLAHPVASFPVSFLLSSGPFLPWQPLDLFASSRSLPSSLGHLSHCPCLFYQTLFVLRTSIYLCVKYLNALTVSPAVLIKTSPTPLPCLFLPSCCVTDFLFGAGASSHLGDSLFVISF